MTYLYVREAPSFDIPDIGVDKHIDPDRWMKLVACVDVVQALDVAKREYAQSCNDTLHERLQVHSEKFKEEVNAHMESHQKLVKALTAVQEESQTFEERWFMQGRFHVEKLMRLMTTFTTFSQATRGDCARLYQTIDARMQAVASAYRDLSAKRESDIALYRAETGRIRRELQAYAREVDRSTRALEEIKHRHRVEAQTIVDEYRRGVNVNVPEKLATLRTQRDAFREDWTHGGFRCPMVDHDTVFTVDLACPEDSNDMPRPMNDCAICVFISGLFNL